MPPKQKRGVVVLKEIVRLFKTGDVVTSKRAFKRVITRIVHENNPKRNVKGHNAIKFKPNALMAIQEATEAYITRLLEDTNLLAIHAKRITIEEKDMALAYRMRGDENEFWWTRPRK